MYQEQTALTKLAKPRRRRKRQKLRREEEEKEEGWRRWSRRKHFTQTVKTKYINIKQGGAKDNLNKHGILLTENFLGLQIIKFHIWLWQIVEEWYRCLWFDMQSSLFSPIQGFGLWLRLGGYYNYSQIINMDS